MDKLILLPPPAFLIIFSFAIIFGQVFLRFLTFKKKDSKDDGCGKAYSCGEDEVKHLIQPDYSQFFPFAFFFTILHIIALMATTVPIATLDSITIAVFYLIGAVISLSVFLRGVREK